MHKATFSADFIGSTVEGWTDGSMWNGWSKPYFEFEEAKRIATMFNEDLGSGTALYDAIKDMFCYNLNGEEECFVGQIIQVEGQELKLYGIGTGTWIWETEDGSFNS